MVSTLYLLWAVLWLYRTCIIPVLGSTSHYNTMIPILYLLYAVPLTIQRYPPSPNQFFRGYTGTFCYGWYLYYTLFGQYLWRYHGTWTIPPPPCASSTEENMVHISDSTYDVGRFNNIVFRQYLWRYHDTFIIPYLGSTSEDDTYVIPSLGSTSEDTMIPMLYLL